MKIIIEADEREAKLMLNAKKLINAIEDLKAYRRSIYKGYTNDIKYILRGQKFTNAELLSLADYNSEELIEFVETDTLIQTIDDILLPVRTLYDEYYDD